MNPTLIMGALTPAELDLVVEALHSRASRLETYARFYPERRDYNGTNARDMRILYNVLSDIQAETQKRKVRL